MFKLTETPLNLKDMNSLTILNYRSEINALGENCNTGTMFLNENTRGNGMFLERFVDNVEFTEFTKDDVPMFTIHATVSAEMKRAVKYKVEIDILHKLNVRCDISMPCSNCCCEFGILKKEVGCEKCGFGFCPKCCKKKEVQEGGTIVKKYLCGKCFLILTGSKPVTISPPLAHKKRMAMFNKKSYSVDESSFSNFSQEKDQELFERLKRLKKDKACSPSEREIEIRLAKLKGMDPSKYNAPPIEVYRPPDRRTSIEKASNLLMQVTEEVHLDSKVVKPEDEIAARLAALRGETVKTADPDEPVPMINPDTGEQNMSVEDVLSNFQEQSQELSLAACKGIKDLHIDPKYKELLTSIEHEKETETSETDEEEAEKLVAQLLATDIPEDLDELESISEPSSEKPVASSKKDSLDEEFPWCVICTNDAKIRCFDCDEDLYCLSCFRECHDSFEIKDHKTCPYIPSKVSTL